MSTETEPSDPESPADETPAEHGPQAQACGQGGYLVAPGDCLSSIAFEHGFLWKTLWNHPDNAALKEARKNPNVIFPGDRVTIPEIKIKQQECATNQRHTFKLKGVPAKLNLRLLDDKRKPRANERYVLEIDGSAKTGTTDGDGCIHCSIPPNAAEGVLKLKNDTERYALLLGHIDPVDDVSGAKGRLANLGYYGGPRDGQWSDAMTLALKSFQKQFSLQVTGELDDATRSKLVDVHGS